MTAGSSVGSKISNLASSKAEGNLGHCWLVGGLFCLNHLDDWLHFTLRTMTQPHTVAFCLTAEYFFGVERTVGEMETFYYYQVGKSALLKVQQSAFQSVQVLISPLILHETTWPSYLSYTINFYLLLSPGTNYILICRTFAMHTLLCICIGAGRLQEMHLASWSQSCSSMMTVTSFGNLFHPDFVEQI